MQSQYTVRNARYAKNVFHFENDTRPAWDTRPFRPDVTRKRVARALKKGAKIIVVDYPKGK